MGGVVQEFLKKRGRGPLDPSPKSAYGIEDSEDSTEDSEVDNRLEKIDFADVVKDAKSIAGFSLSTNFEWDLL